MVKITWVEQDDCTACSLCPEIAPDVFEMRDSGLAYSIEESMYGTGETAVTEKWEQVIDAAEECPGECIMVGVGGC